MNSNIIKHTIDFTGPTAIVTEAFSLLKHTSYGYNDIADCWQLAWLGQSFMFILKLPQKQDVCLSFYLASYTDSNSQKKSVECPIKITINGQLIVRDFNVRRASVEPEYHSLSSCSCKYATSRK